MPIVLSDRPLSLSPSPRVRRSLSKSTLLALAAETLLDTFGTTSMDFVEGEIARLSNCRYAGEPSGDEQRDLNAALAVIDGTRPENEAAAMLAS